MSGQRHTKANETTIDFSGGCYDTPPASFWNLAWRNGVYEMVVWKMGGGVSMSS